MLVASVIVTALLLGVRQIGWLQPLELAAYDWMVRVRPAAAPDPRLLIVKITEEDIQARRHWPLSDQIIADTLQIISQAEPTVIGLDVYRDLPHEPGHQALAAQLQSPRVVVIKKMGDSNSVDVPAPANVPANRVGFNDLLLDPDSVIRRNLMYAGDSVAFSLLVALRYLWESGISSQPYLGNDNKWFRLGQAVFKPLKKNSGGYQTIDADGYQILINYRPGNEIAREISITKVLNGDLPPAWAKDKIVLIGTTAPSIKDLFFTPYSVREKETVQRAGVEMHAYMVSQILDAALGTPGEAGPDRFMSKRGLFEYWPEWLEILWISAWAVWGGFLAWRFQHLFWPGVLAVASIGGLTAITTALFFQGVWMPLFAPAAAFLASAGGVLGSRLSYHVFYDLLTGLPNRTLFMKRLQRLQRKTSSQDKERQNLSHPHPTMAVLLLNLERFKIINAVLGAKAGDRLLIAIAERVRKILEDAGAGWQNSILARFGGDEFGILLKNVSGVKPVTDLADEIHRRMANPFNLEGEEVFATAHIGIAFVAPDEDRELLRDAHAAMNRAKVLGKSSPEVFESTMEAGAITRFHTERDLRQAVARCKKQEAEQADGLPVPLEFVPYYQALISLSTGRIIGFEALVRWQHPQRGLVSPGEFIPVAEETGVIIPIGAWVLKEACWQMRKWQQQFSNHGPLLISVNLSRRQFGQADLIECVEGILAETGMEPRSLKLEITESVMMSDWETSARMLQRLKALNVKLSIDDFGTGYSSLSSLTEFPTDTLKVDQAFIKNMRLKRENRVIVEMIIALAHNLHMEVIAEGIELKEQLADMRSLGCEYGQGYLFAKPLPRDDAEALLASDPRW
ncbi:MAG: EAL domain-containing protein [Gammaproteobacteria bacterium]|nr:EAL domain-containing protein [Gammaproteobacteria bacterium]